MLLIPVFLAAFAVAFFTFRSKGERTADCVHKGLVAGLLVTLLAFALVTAWSYI